MAEKPDAMAQKTPRRREPDCKKELPVVTAEDQDPAIPTIAQIFLPEHYDSSPLVPRHFPEETTGYLRGKPSFKEMYEVDNVDLEFLGSVATHVTDAGMELEKMIEVWEDATGKEAPIDYQTALSLWGKQRPGGLSVRVAYEYWRKRREDLQHPLCRKYWKTDVSQDQMVKQVFNLRKPEKMRLRVSKSSEESAFKQLWRLRDDLEEVMDLLSCMEARERLKKQSVELEIAQQEQELGEMWFPGFRHPHLERMMTASSSLMSECEYLRSDQQYLELLLQPKTILDLTYAQALPTRQLRAELDQAVTELKRSLEDLGL